MPALPAPVPADKATRDAASASRLLADADTGLVPELLSALKQLELSPGDVLFREGETPDCLYLVVVGELEVFGHDEQGNEVTLGRVGAGEPLGEIPLLLGGKRSASARAMQHTRLAVLPADAFRRLVEASGALRAGLEAVVLERQRRNQLRAVVEELFGEVAETAFAELEGHFEWVHLGRGDYLFRSGDEGDSLAILVNGMLWATVPDEQGVERSVGLIRRGELVGEMGVLTGETRSAGICAARPSDLVRLTRGSLEALALKHPELMLRITRKLVQRFKRVQQLGSKPQAVARSMAVLPAAGHVVARTLVDALARSTGDAADLCVISSDTVRAAFGADVLAAEDRDNPLHVALEGWLEEQESRHEFVCYLADDGDTQWTRRCVSRADELLVVASAGDDPAPGPVERGIYADEGLPGAPAACLVLVHPADRRVPRRTQAWLEPRRLDAHYHLREGNEGDLARLARILTNRATGMVLGGGGARGIAHIGVMRAFEEAGVPIDLVGGTSIGAIIAALYAKGQTPAEMLDHCHHMFVRINPFNEYTLPVYSLLGSKKLDLVSLKSFGGLQIEDLWRSFFCISTSLTQQRQVVHRHGPVWKAIRATSALPGIVVPVVYGEDVHVDGGVLNNLPGDVMRPDCRTLVSVDVRPAVEMLAAGGGFPSPWRALLARLMPGGEPTAAAPHIPDLLMGSMLTGSNAAASQVRAYSDLVLAPPVAEVGMLEFRELERIERIGYEYAARLLDEGAAEQLLALR